jgi:hypothetical protein
MATVAIAAAFLKTMHVHCAGSPRLRRTTVSDVLAKIVCEQVEPMPATIEDDLNGATA